MQRAQSRTSWAAAALSPCTLHIRYAYVCMGTYPWVHIHGTGRGGLSSRPLSLCALRGLTGPWSEPHCTLHPAPCTLRPVPCALYPARSPASPAPSPALQPHGEQSGVRRAKRAFEFHLDRYTGRDLLPLLIYSMHDRLRRSPLHTALGSHAATSVSGCTWLRLHLAQIAPAPSRDQSPLKTPPLTTYYLLLTTYYLLLTKPSQDASATSSCRLPHATAAQAIASTMT